jgi:hypothetical protein
MRLFLAFCGLAIGILPELSVAAELVAEEPIEVGLAKQLVVDDYVIAEKHGLTRRIGTVTKANGGAPLVFTRTTNAASKLPIDVWPLFASVFYDPVRERFRMWHRISLDDKSRRAAKNATDEELGVGTGYHRAYSESTDGLQFNLVGLLKGLTTSGDTNLVVTIDEHEPNPAHRYKIGYDCAGEVHAAALAHSADGIDWTPYNDGQPVTYRASDFPNQIVWDPAVQAYRLFTRTDFGGGGGPLAGKVDVKVGKNLLEVRGVRSMTNPDVKADPKAWTLEHHFVLDGDETISAKRPPVEELLKDPAYVERCRKQALRRQIYAMTDWAYEGVHFGLVAVLEYPTDVSEGTVTDHVTRHERSIENFYIATSRDGLAWNFHWIYAGQPLVPRGPAGAWDKDMLFPTTQIVTHQDKHWIYYGANNERHGAAEKNVWFSRAGSIGLAWLRLDGFVALESEGQSGSLVTRPFRLDGTTLELNVDASRGGTVRVEVLNAAGQAIPGYTREQATLQTNIDALRAKPTWKEHPDLSALKGQTVRLKIQLDRARLYAFQIQP